jgi:hypothetical protein
LQHFQDAPAMPGRGTIVHRPSEAEVELKEANSKLDTVNGICELFPKYLKLMATLGTSLFKDFHHRSPE